jgi:glycosyl transferase family 25
MNRYLINLDRSPERLARMRAIFKAMGLDFQRIAAVDGRSLPRDRIDSLTRPKSDGMPWTDQEVGVALSHLNCWKLIAEGSDPFGAVFEDDLYFSYDSYQFLKGGSWINWDFDVIKLETTLINVSIDRRYKIVYTRRIHKMLSNHWGAGAYIMSKDFATRLMKEVNFLSDQPDVVLFRQPSDIRAYQLVPALCIQDLSLRGGNSVGYLASTLEAERIPLRKCPKPRGWAKIRREVSRPFFQLRELVRDIVQPLFGRTTIRIPMRW